MAFVVGGFEHCVANMFYIPVGMMAAQNPAYVAKAQEAYGLTAEQKTQVESILQGAEQTRTYLGKIRAEVQTPLKYKTKKNDKTCRIVEN